MSADNWAKCPRCVKNAPPDQAEDYYFARTFREDYEFYGAEEGFITADYRGGCTECGLRLEFEYTQTLDVEAKP